MVEAVAVTVVIAARSSLIEFKVSKGQAIFSPFLFAFAVGSLGFEFCMLAADGGCSSSLVGGCSSSERGAFCCQGY